MVIDLHASVVVMIMYAFPVFVLIGGKVLAWHEQVLDQCRANPPIMSPHHMTVFIFLSGLGCTM